MDRKVIPLPRLKIRQYLWAQSNFKSPYLHQPGVKPELLAFAIGDVATQSRSTLSLHLLLSFSNRTVVYLET